MYAKAFPDDVKDTKVALLVLYCNTSYRNADTLLFEPVMLNDEVVVPVVEMLNITPDAPVVVKFNQHSMMYMLAESAVNSKVLVPSLATTNTLFVEVPLDSSTL